MSAVKATVKSNHCRYRTRYMNLSVIAQRFIDIFVGFSRRLYLLN